MIFVLKFTRWIYNTLAGAMTPTQIAYGLCLGLFVALMPMGLFEPQTWVVVLLLLLTRASIWLFMLTAAILKPLMLLGLDALPWKLGRAILEDAAGLRGFLGKALNAPVVALFPLDRYAVFGGFVLALALSVVFFYPIRMFVVWFRRTIQPRADQYRIVRWWRGFFLTRALSYVFVGDQAR
jgi:uncharacterized protein (TIGR03546 family)